MSDPSASSYKTEINSNRTSSKYGQMVYVKNGELAPLTPGTRRNTNITSSNYGKEEPINPTSSSYKKEPTVPFGVSRSSVSKNMLSSRSSSSYESHNTVRVNVVNTVKPFPEPEPDNWEFVRQYQHPNALVIEIRYPNCTNYEGRKVMVFKIKGGFSELMKKNKGLLDPHFHDTQGFVPLLARFEPTTEGWKLANNLAKSI